MPDRWSLIGDGDDVLWVGDSINARMFWRFYLSSMRFALSIHDLRVSGDAETVRVLQGLLDRYPFPLTALLVFDRPLEASPHLLAFLLQQVPLQRLEVVFHGVSHACPPTVGRATAFYHKSQAEYLEDSEAKRSETKASFMEAKRTLGMSLGICPPCWLATKRNRVLFTTLQPAYIEAMLWLDFGVKRVPAPVVSLGSPEPGELRWLRALAHLIGGVSRRIPGARLRIAIHTCDLAIPASMALFTGLLQSLTRVKAQGVLQRNLP